MLNLPDGQYLFPNAPLPHPQVPQGLMWYDLSTRQGLETSRQQLTDWLLSLPQTTGIPISRTVLAGFSQGGAMTLDVGTHLPFAGLISLSGYLHPAELQPLGETIPPVLIVHGRQDPVVPLQAAHIARDRILEAGGNVQYHELDMGHEIRPPVLGFIQSFIQTLNLD